MAGTPSAPAAPGLATPPLATPPQPTPPPATPPPPATANPDNDPNLAMSQIVARSKAKAEGKPVDPPKSPDPAPSEPPKEPSKAGSTPPARLNDLIGKALKMRPTEVQKAPDPPVTPPIPTPEPPATSEPPAEPTASPAKKPTKTKKPAPEIDPVAVAREAATAATEAALRAIPKEPAKATIDPLEGLTDDDKRDYEVAQHLAKLDPRFKDAPEIIISNLKKAESYAEQWEAANPGKQFDPNDDEHDEFFAGIKTPWTQSQFQNAAIDLLAEKKTAKLRDEQNERLRGVEAASARAVLKPIVDQHFSATTIAMAKALGDEVAKTLETEGWNGLAEHDPVLAQVMGATMQQMHPFIEAAVHIDDPRIGLDKNDPMHQQWSVVVQQGEAMAQGMRDDQGRLFARRADYARMTPAERARHWYLTTDHIIQGALEFAAEQVQKITESQKQQLEKLGFKREVKAKTGTTVTQTKDTTPVVPPAVPADKPVSPSVGSGAKIDAQGDAPKTKEAQLMQQISGILFRR